MCIVHFSTHVTGGAGAFANSIHVTMQELGIKSVLLTRENNDLDHTHVIKPLKRITTSLHARWLGLLVNLGLLKSKYATFGIEKTPVNYIDIKLALVSRDPTVFIFYWVSYFVDVKCMHELRLAYPDIPFLFICLDEAYLTGGCHYTWGCHGFESKCADCPSTLMTHRKKRIEYEFRQRATLFKSINPLVLYPTTNLEKIGKKSVILKNLRSAVIPLGAVSIKEKIYSLSSKRENNKLTLLVRSSSEYRKGCDLFVDSIKKICLQIPDIRTRLEVVSIGDSTLQDAMIQDYVDHSYLGFVGRDELMAIYKKVDVLVVTSREDAGPIMINEFVALEKFVITTPVGVAQDLIVNIKNGLVISEFSSDAICAALIYLLDNPGSYFNESSCSSTAGAVSEQLTFEGYVNILLNSIQVMQ